MLSYHAEKWGNFTTQNTTFIPFLAVKLNYFESNCMLHQSTTCMCQLGHEEFVLNCCLVAMITNHVSNLQYISLQISVSCCYGDCLFKLWFISYAFVRSTFYDCLILPTIAVLRHSCHSYMKHNMFNGIQWWTPHYLQEVSKWGMFLAWSYSYPAYHYIKYPHTYMSVWGKNWIYLKIYYESIGPRRWRYAIARILSKSSVRHYVRLKWTVKCFEEEPALEILWKRACYYCITQGPLGHDQGDDVTCPTYSMSPSHWSGLQFL